MSSVFVIGAGGFIGRHLVRHLAAHGCRVLATHRPGTAAAALDNVDWIATDLTAGSERWPATYDTLIYLAQSPQWRDFPGGARDVFQVNVTALHRAVEHARLAGAKRFIHLSTGTVYTQHRVPAVEGEAIPIASKRSFYAASKLAAEVLLGPYADLLHVIQLRLFMPYGVGQNERMLLPLLVNKVNSGAAIDLHAPDGLSCNPIAVRDVAEAICRCLALDGSHTLNVAGPEVLTLRQVAEAIGTALGKSPVLQTKAESAPVIVGDIAQLQATLGWTPPTRFAAGVKDWLK